MSLVNLVYCHIGESLPNYIFENIYQTLVICKDDSLFQIHVILNQKHIENFKKLLYKLNLDSDKLSRIFIFPSEILNSENLNKYIELKNKWNKDISAFRDNFWIHTTSRFFYIDALITQFELSNVFHIENDVLIYNDLTKIYKSLLDNNIGNKLVAVQDAPNRAICSIIFIPNSTVINDFTEYIITSIKKNPSQNDMTLLGLYKEKFYFPESPDNKLVKNLGIFDACCIGQYMGGVDFKNIPNNYILNPYINPTIGFINETSVFKPDTVKFKKSVNPECNLKKYLLVSNDDTLNINCIHIHSKQLYLFSSYFDISFLDIITGDTVLGLCDLVITTRDKLYYHKNIDKFKSLNDIILIKDWNNINITAFKQIIHEKSNSKQTNSKIISLFVYIDYMQHFQKLILPNLPSEYKYVLYSQNGDYGFDNKYSELVNSDKILKIYAQNLDLPVHEKLQLLPIGIANSMFAHGNLMTLYETMISSYIYKKVKNIYINLNSDTYSFRSTVIEKIKKNTTYNLITDKKSYKDYLKELSQHNFSLCVRGNGIDTHRFWESLYLGVIPVIINDGTLNNFIEQLNKINIPHYVINTITFFDNQDSCFFNDKLFNSVLNTFCIKSIQICNFLKVGYYNQM